MTTPQNVPAVLATSRIRAMTEVCHCTDARSSQHTISVP